MKTIAFMNKKGGVGKTTLTYHYGKHLSNIFDKSVLLVDLDSQNNLTSIVNNKCIENDKFFNFKIEKVTDKESEKLYFLRPPQSIKTINNYILKNKTLKSFSALNYLFNINKDKLLNFDYILIDCSPTKDINDDIINNNIIYMSNKVFIPYIANDINYNSTIQFLHILNNLEKHYSDVLKNKIQIDREIILNCYKTNHKVLNREYDPSRDKILSKYFNNIIINSSTQIEKNLCIDKEFKFLEDFKKLI